MPVVFDDGDLAADRVGLYHFALVRNTLADIARAVPVGDRKPRASRKIPCRGEVVDHDSLAVEAVGRDAIDAVRQSACARGERAAVIDGLVGRAPVWTN